jgi:predicted transcriptional regulator
LATTIPPIDDERKARLDPLAERLNRVQILGLVAVRAGIALVDRAPRSG